MLRGDVMDKEKTRLPIARIGALIVVNDDNNTTEKAAMPIYAQTLPQAVFHRTYAM